MMARNTNKINYEDDYYKGLAKPYFFGILDKIIEYGNLSDEEGLILDFGCGQGYLTKALGYPKNVIGYDIIESLTEVKDYKKLNPKVMVCSGVLEHMTTEEINDLMIWCQERNIKKLLVFLPTENIVSKIGMILTGQINAHDDHITKFKDVNNIIERYYKIKRRCYYFFRMAQITLYEMV